MHQLTDPSHHARTCTKAFVTSSTRAGLESLNTRESLKHNSFKVLLVYAINFGVIVVSRWRSSIRAIRLL